MNNKDINQHNANENNLDIFCKHTEDLKDNDLSNLCMSKKDVLNSIPKNHVLIRNNELLKIKAEWRWRIFKFPTKKNEVIEISFKNPNKKRLFINKFGEWVETEISKEFDPFVIKEYFCYIEPK